MRPGDLSQGPRLSELLRVVTGGSVEEAHALHLAENQARAMIGTCGLIWMSDECVGIDPVPDAVHVLTDRIEGTDAGLSYRQAKRALARLSNGREEDRLSPGHISDLALTVHSCELRTAYYLGLARGWLAAWRLRGGVR